MEENLETPSLEEARRTSIQKMAAIKFIHDQFFQEKDNVMKKVVFTETFVPLDAAATLRFGSFELFANAISALGTEKHKDFIEKSLNGDVRR